MAQQFFFVRLEGGGRARNDQHGRIVGNFANFAQNQLIELEISLAELIGEFGNAAIRRDVVGLEFTVAGHEINFLFIRGHGDFEDRAGDRLFAEEAGAFAFFKLKQVLIAQDADATVADDEDLVLLCLQQLGFARTLINVQGGPTDFFRGWLIFGRVKVFTEQRSEIHKGLRVFVVLTMFVERDENSHRFVQLREIGKRLCRKREPVQAGDVEARCVIERQIIEPSDQGEKQDGLQYQVRSAHPTCGAKAFRKMHSVNCVEALPRRRGC